MLRPIKAKPLRVAAKDAASLDRPCARRPRVGAEECSRRGSNQRMDQSTAPARADLGQNQIVAEGSQHLTSNVPYKGGMGDARGCILSGPGAPKCTSS